jgi:2-dehydro-3-deoxygluconokinase
VTGEAPDVIALGETMLSLVAREGSLDTASEFVATHGGAETNALVALAAAGFRTAWVSRLGKDEAGQRIRRELTEAGVDLRWVIIDPERPTGLMLRDTVGSVRYWRSGSAASELTPHDLDGVPIADARAVLVSGITAMLGPGPQAAAISFLDGARGLRAVDPNLRPGLWGSWRGRELIVPLMERCDVVLGGEGELATLMGGEGASESARRCAELGPSEVVVKRGGRGAAMLDPDGAWHEIRPQTAEEIDPVGAGDAFNAAYLGTRLSGGSCVEALRTAAGAGAVAAGSFGDAVSRNRDA